MSASLEPDLVVTHGTFSIDGDDFDVDNNIWIVGDVDECLVIDAAHDATAIARVAGGRRVRGILCTHGHNDHINAAVALRGLVDAPIVLHPADGMLWDIVHPNESADRGVDDGDTFRAGGVTLRALHTPGHSPGGVSFADEANGRVFAGDTLFKGGPGATGRSYSDFPTIIGSIRRALLTLPPETLVLPGHGATTTIADEAPHLTEWIARGH